MVEQDSYPQPLSQRVKKELDAITHRAAGSFPVRNQSLLCLINHRNPNLFQDWTQKVLYFVT